VDQPEHAKPGTAYQQLELAKCAAATLLLEDDVMLECDRTPALPCIARMRRSQ